MSRVKDAGRVHFTHHLCEVHGNHHAASWIDRYDHATGVSTPSVYTLAGFNTHGRPPESWGCRNSRRKGEGVPKFTIHAREVTCSLCREENKRHTERVWEEKSLTARDGDRAYFKNWRSDEELTQWSWFVCCRHHEGVPSPFASAVEERAFLLEKRARAVLSVTKAVSFYMLPDDILARFRERISKLPTEDQVALASFAEEAERVEKLALATRKGFEKLDELAAMAALCVQYPKQRKARAA